MKRRLFAVAVLVASLVSFAGAPAKAAAVRECVVTGTMTFQPPLSGFPVLAGGYVTYSYNAGCEVANTTGPSLTPVSYSNSVTYPYIGNCAAAVIDGAPWTGVIVGGTTMTIVTHGSTTVGAGVYALVPSGLNPCAMATASVVQVQVD